MHESGCPTGPVPDECARHGGSAIENATTPGWFPDPWDSGRLRYHDGELWTGHVRPLAPAVTGAVEGNLNFPLESDVLILRALPQPRDVDVACAVDDGQGRELATITSLGGVPSTIGREIEDLNFVVVASNGAQRLRFSKIGGSMRRNNVVARGPSGQEIGRLRQTSSYWRQFRTPRLSMALESGGHRLGHTDVCLDPEKTRFAEVQAPIFGNGGEILATVQRRWRYVDTISDFFDYRLVCPGPQPWPVPDLLLTTAFSHYLYDRLAVGGPLGSYNRFGRGGTWHDPR